MGATTATFVAPPLVEYVCPDCLKRGKRRVLVRGEKGATFEAYCRECKFRKIVRI